MTAHRASTFVPTTASRAASWLALSLGTPAVVAAGFFAGWLLGSAVLRPVQAALIEEGSS
jgi:hypothetical protein